MSRKRKYSSSAVGGAVEGGEKEEGETLGKKLLRWMERKQDVTFLVGAEEEQEEIKASSILLSALSRVFDVMFNENWKQQVVKLPDIKPKIFRHFLRLLKSETVKIEDLIASRLAVEEILHMLYVAKKYEAESIMSSCRAWITDNITTQNVLFIYLSLQIMDEPELEKEAFQFITIDIQAVMNGELFLELSEKHLMDILDSDYLCVQEVTLFKGVYRWAESKCTLKNVAVNGKNIREELGSVLFRIRFPLMTSREFFKSVEPTGIFSPEEVVEIARSIAMKGDSSFANKSGFSCKERQKDWTAETLALEQILSDGVWPMLPSSSKSARRATIKGSSL